MYPSSELGRRALRLCRRAREACGPCAVDRKGDTRDVARSRGEQKRDHVCNFVGGGDAAHGDAGLDMRAYRRIAEVVRRHVREGVARANGVDADAMRSQIE